MKNNYYLANVVDVVTVINVILDNSYLKLLICQRLVTEYGF